MPRPIIPNPHDALFKAAFDDPEHARGLLCAALPAELGRAIDWTTLTRLPASFVSGALHEQHADLLFAATWRDPPDSGARVYFLFEHQSGPERRMLFRLLRYLLRIWERLRLDHRRAPPPPLVVAVVLYHGPTPWPVPRSLGAALDVPAGVRALADHLLRFTYLVDDLTALPDAALRDRPLTPFARLALLCLKHARSHPDLLGLLAGWTDDLRAAAAHADAGQTLAALLQYVMLVNDGAEPDALRDLLERTLGPDTKDLLMTPGERLIQQGFDQGIRRGVQQGMQQGLQQGMQQGLQQGMQQGLQQGMQQGLQQGKAALLLLLLRQRFGAAVDAAAERRVTAASLEQLDRWSAHLLAAASVDELLAR